jgi:hypothetical protein
VDNNGRSVMAEQRNVMDISKDLHMENSCRSVMEEQCDGMDCYKDLQMDNNSRSVMEEQCDVMDRQGPLHLQNRQVCHGEALAMALTATVHGPPRGQYGLVYRGGVVRCHGLLQGPPH